MVFRGRRPISARSGRARNAAGPALLLLLVIAASTPAQAGLGQWSDEFGLPSADGPIQCAIRFGGDLIVGGSFHRIGGIPADFIARWDGTAWHSMGTGPDDQVTSLAVYRGDLYVAGRFQYVDGRFSPSVAKWDGRAWTPVGAFTGAYCCCYDMEALAVYRGELIAGGDFGPGACTEARGIERWDGDTWRTLGQGVSGVVQSMLVVGDSLYVGGEFNAAGGAPASNIALWDGTEWSALGQGLTLSSWGVVSLAWFQGRLYAGGGIDSAGGAPARWIAAWDGAHWSSVDGLDAGPALAMAVSADTLFVASIAKLARWNGAAWGPDVTGFVGYTSQLLSDPDGLLAVGQVAGLGEDGGISGFGVVRWSGGSWHGYETWDARMKGLATFPGTPVAVNCLGSYQGDLVVGGDAEYTGTGSGWQFAAPVLRWNGSTWSTMPFPGGVLYGEPQAFLSEGDTLYTAGRFYGGDFPYERCPVIRWDGSQWTLLDTLSTPGACIGRYAGRLVVGTAAYGDDPASAGVFSFDGSKWMPLGLTGGGWYGASSGAVLAFTIHQGSLVAGGSFTSIGGIEADDVAAWDGQTWRSFGGGSAFPVDRRPVRVVGLASYHGALLAAGDFWTRRGPYPLMMWEGVDWRPVDGITGIATGMSIIEGRVFLTGILHVADSQEDASVALWDGFSWTALGTTNGSPPQALAESGNSVYFGGYFSAAAGRSAFSIARWTGLGPGAASPNPRLSPGRPNPFIAGADFSIQLGHPGRVRIAVYDVHGKEVAVLDASNRPAGTYTIRWDGRDRAGQPAPAGVYFINVRDAAGVTSSRKVVRLR